MDPVRNPYTPNAGAVPPELAGRDEILAGFQVALRRVALGRDEKGYIVKGLRGVGKTVLLVRMGELAADEGAVVVHHEASKSEDAFRVEFPAMVRQALLQTSPAKRWGDRTRRAASVLTRFRAEYDPTGGTWSFGVALDPEPGFADSGRFLRDVPDMVEALGEAAKEAGRVIVFLVDEIQYLGTQELSSLIMAKHRVNQKRLPIIIAGAGLPQLPSLTTEAQTYAERMFTWTFVGKLDTVDAEQALVLPAREEAVDFNPDAVAEIIAYTEGYPYFIQEYGKAVWNNSLESPITVDDALAARELVENTLDADFFSIRTGSLTDKELEVVKTMGHLGVGPHQLGVIATAMGYKSSSSLGSLQQRLTTKGVVWSPSRGLLDFTVPQFDRYVQRAFPR